MEKNSKLRDIILSTKQVAEMLGVNNADIYHYVKNEGLKTLRRTGKKLLFSKSEVIAWKPIFDIRQREKMAEESMKEKLLSVKEVVKFLNNNYSVSTIYSLVESGVFPCEREQHGKQTRYFFRKEDIFSHFYGKEMGEYAESQICDMLETPPATYENAA